jgi:ketosteroid isomerase-like protein
MSQENVETFRRSVEAVNRWDIEAILEAVDPEVVWEPLRSQVQGAYRGRQGMRDFLADTTESFDSFRLDHTDVRDLGDGRVLAIGTAHIRGKGSGIETDVPTAGIATYRQGRLIHWKDFGEKDQALEAAGLLA